MRGHRKRVAVDVLVVVLAKILLLRPEGIVTILVDVSWDESIHVYARMDW